jgi:hypothetical protein
MNKLGYQPMPVLLRAEPNDARATSNSAKILHVVAALGGILALGGAVAICLVAFKATPPKEQDLKASAGALVDTASKAPPITAVDHENSASASSTGSDQVSGATIADDHAIIDQPPTPALGANSLPAAVAPASPNEALTGQASGDPTLANPETRQLPESLRKKLEKRRQLAEHKRARLEEMYRTHAISTDAYKNGETKYRNEIERYRREMNAGRTPKNAVAGQD